MINRIHPPSLTRPTLLIIAVTAITAMAAEPSKLPPLEMARLLLQRQMYVQARGALILQLYQKDSGVEEEYLLGQAFEGLNRKQDAVALYTMCQRSLEELGPSADARLAAMGKDAQARITRLDIEGARQRKAYLDTAAGKHFESPEKVSDLWMTQVTATKLTYMNLDRPGACLNNAMKKGWVFDGPTATIIKPPPGKEKALQSPMKLTGPQQFPQRHVSGAGYIDQVGGRKGILHLNPNWKTKQPGQLKIRNAGKGDFLRIGASSPVWSMPNCEVAASQDNADFVLNVLVGDKKIFTQIVGGRKWTDLKIDLGEFRGKDVEFIVEDAAGGNEPYINGAYFDYVDFFKD
jgi:hypothetical protein